MMLSLLRLLRASSFSLVSALLLGVIAPGHVAAQVPAQEPLLYSAPPVRSNISIMLDDSGSMEWDCTYPRWVNTTFTRPLGEVDDCYTDPVTNATLNVGDPRYHAPALNPLAYDPSKSYSPSFSAPNVLRAQAAVNTFFPLAANAIVTTSGTRTITFTMPRYPIPTTGGANTHRIIMVPVANFVPGTNTSIISGLVGANLSNRANYIHYAVSAAGFFNYGPGGAGPGGISNLASAATAVNPLLKTNLRTDCTLNALYCTLAEEMQNMANWQRYHRSRILAARTGMSLAFDSLPNVFRFNYTTLGIALTNPDRSLRAENDISAIGPVRDYATDIGNFQTWLENTFNTSRGTGTPLKQGLDKIGRTYKNNTSNTGPWGTTPWAPLATETAANHLSCRRSYAILATDGFWNNGSGPMATPTVVVGTDQDGTTYPVIADHPNAASIAGMPTNYRYTPRGTNTGNTNANRWNIGKADSIVAGAGINETLADVALHYWATDLRSTMTNNVSNDPVKLPYWQHLNLYTVAFGANGQLSQAQVDSAKNGQLNWPQPLANQATTIDDLQHAAHNGGGRMLLAVDARGLQQKIRDLVLDLSKEELSTTGVTTNSNLLLAGDGSVKYATEYTSGDWWGNVKSTKLISGSGNEVVSLTWSVIEVDAGNVPTGTTTIPSPSNRNIVVYATTTAVPFTSSSLSINGLIGTGASQLTSTWNADLTNYIRGNKSLEGDNQPYRSRPTILGDMVNSTPVFIKNKAGAYGEILVGAPRPTGPTGTTDTAYYDYLTRKGARTEGTLFVGANDGMLHAFAENDGRELFAYIPRAVLPNLHLLADKNYGVNHRFYVDGPLTEADALIATRSSPQPTWTNVLLGTTGAGAKAVFALDVTNNIGLTANSVLWEVNSTQPAFSQTLGYITSKVDHGYTVSGDWIAAFGNGVGSTGGQAKLIIVNLSTGAHLATLNTNTASNNGLGGVRLVRNTQGKVTGAYAGDLQGNVWRFNLNSSASTGWLDGQKLFTAPPSGSPATSVSFTATPAAVLRTDLPNNSQSYMVVAGTGRLLYSTDVGTATYPTQSVYGLWDRNAFDGSGPLTATFSEITPSELVTSLSINSTATTVGGGTLTTTFDILRTVSTTTTLNWSIHRGWKLELRDITNQRVTYPVEALGIGVLISTTAPRPNGQSCDINANKARAVNYVLDPLRGACLQNKSVDTNDDKLFDTRDSFDCGYGRADIIADGSDAYLLRDTTDGAHATENSSSKSVVICVKAGGCDVIPPPPGAPPFERQMRQIFIRK